jgi:hypothetical protein
MSSPERGQLPAVLSGLLAQPVKDYLSVGGTGTGEVPIPTMVGGTGTGEVPIPTMVGGTGTGEVPIPTTVGGTGTGAPPMPAMLRRRLMLVSTTSSASKKLKR